MLILVLLLNKDVFKQGYEYWKTNNGSKHEEGHIDWARINNDTHIYSAFWDTRGIDNTSPVVRLVAIGLLQGIQMKPKCVLKYNENVTYVPMQEHTFNGHWSKKHSAMFYVCFPASEIPPDYATLEWNGTLGAWKRVIDSTRGSVEGNMAACVPPIFGPYNDTLRIAEYLGYYELMGVTNFSFYERNITENTRSFLNLLKKKGFPLTIHPWSLPQGLEIFSVGQHAFTQDCIYRHAKDYEFILTPDLDELLVLKSNQTLLSFVQETDKNFGSVVFKNTLFCRDFDDPKTTLKSEGWLTKEYMDTSLHILIRAKLITRTAAVVVSGIHDIQVWAKEFNYRFLDPSVGASHHYRDEACKKKLSKDKSALKFVSGIKSSFPMTVWYDHHP